MDLIKKKYELLEERTACEQAKQDAHNRIIEINKTLKKLENLIAEADEILGGLYPYPEEGKKEWPPKVHPDAIGMHAEIEKHYSMPVPTDSEINQAINER